MYCVVLKQKVPKLEKEISELFQEVVDKVRPLGLREIGLVDTLRAYPDDGL